MAEEYKLDKVAEKVDNSSIYPRCCEWKSIVPALNVKFLSKWRKRIDKDVVEVGGGAETVQKLWGEEKV